VTADSVLGIGHGPDSGEPLVQAERAVLENRARLVRELLFAVAAFEKVPRNDLSDVRAATLWSEDLSTRPFDLPHVSAARRRIGEIANAVE